jgi:RHS repeat-associated protein
LLLVFFITSIITALLQAAPSEAEAKEEKQKEEKVTEDRTELQHLNTHDCKFYKNKDGSITAELTLNPEPAIDNSLVELSGSQENFYQNKNNRFKATFPAKLKNNLLDFTYKGKSISLELKEQKKADISAARNNSKIRYDEVLKSVDINYLVVDNGVKEDIIIKDAGAPDEISFTIKVGPLTWKEGENGRVDFYADNEEKLLLYLNPLSVVTAQGKPSDAVTVQIEKGANNSVEYTLKIDKKKLAKTDYPLTIDPTITIAPDENESMDTYIESHNEHEPQERNRYPDIYVGTFYAYEKHRGLIKFNISSLPQGNISSANLKLYGDHPTQTNIRAHQLTTEWLENEVSYSNAKFNEPWNHTGGDYATTYYTLTQSGDFGDYIFTGNIAPLVTNWVKGTTPNYGVLLKAADEGIENIDEDNHEFCLYSGTLIVTYTADTTAPTVSLTSPAKNSTLSGSVSIAASVNDASPIDRVEFYANNELLGTVSQSPYQLTWHTTMYPDGVYTLKVKAYDLAGNAGTITDNNYTVTVTNPLTAPAGLTAALSGGRVELNWNPVNTGRVTYNIYRDTAPNITPTESKKIAGALGDTSYTDQGPFDSGTTYYYRVTAAKVDTGGQSAPSNEVSLLYSGGVQAPSALSARSDSTGSIYLNWSPSPTQPCSYRIYRHTASGFTPSVDKRIATVTQTSYTDNGPGLTLNTTYYYLVTALAPDNSESGPSNEAAVKCGGSVDESGQRLGIKAFYSYAQMDIPRADSMVNMGNGNLVVSYTDSLIPGNKLVSSMRRTYNSMNKTDGVFGWGWSVNLTQGLTINPDNSVTFSHGDGYKETFSYNAGVYQPQAGSYLRLTKNADNTYDICSKENITYHFDAAGRLLTMRDLNNNTITYSYTSGRLTTITDTAGRNTNLSYNAGNKIISITDPRNIPTTYGYDVSGNLTTVTDPQGYVTRLYYDQSHNLTRITSPARSEQHLNYDINGRVVNITDGMGHSTSFNYDMVNGLATVTDAEGNSTRFTFTPATGVVTAITDALNQNYTFARDGNFNPTSITNPRGVTTSYTYDTMGNMLTKNISDGGSSINYTAAYNSLNLPVSLTRPDNTTITYGYDSCGNLTSTSDALNYTTSYQYDIKGRRTRTTDPENNITAYTYDTCGNVTSLSDANNHTTTFAYNNMGIITSTTDAMNNITNYVYDNLGRLTRTNNPDGSFTSSQINGENRLTMSTGPRGEITSYSYDGAGRLISVTNPKRNTTTYSYDAVGNLLSETDPENVTVTKSYDALNRLTGVTDAASNTFSFYYDPCGNMTEIVHPLGHAQYQTYDYLNRKTASGRRESHNGANLNQATYTYDIMGNLVSQTDPLNHTTTYNYNANGWLLSVTDAAGQTNSYTYDMCQNLLTSTDALNHTTSYNYDNVGKVLTETLPDNTHTSWTYDAVNRTASQTDAAGRTTNYAYDNMGRLTGKTYLSTPTTPPVTYSYDQAGRRIRMVDGIGTSTYQYDLNGNLVEVRDCLGREVTYSYDDVNRRVSMGTSFGSVNYEYDNTGSVEAITDFKGNRITFDYDADGKTTNINYPQGGTAVYAYNHLDQMTSLDFTNALGSYNRAGFQYDANGNCIHISQQRYEESEYDDLSENTNAFTYDSLGRLVQSSFSSPDAYEYDINYTYDAAGNRINYLYDTYQNYNDKDIAYTYNSTNCLTYDSESDGDYNNAYEYDANGNQKKVISTYRRSGYTYPAYTMTRVFDRENRLTQVDEENEHTNDTKCNKFYYNGDGQLMKVVNTEIGDDLIWDSVFYLYDGDQVIADLDGANALIACYTRTGGGRMLSMYNSENNVEGIYDCSAERDTYYTFCDQLGTVMGLYGKETEKTVMKRYESYGFNNGTNGIMRFSFTGAPYFSEVGLYQMGARYYNPDIGRFITRDSYRGDIYKPWTRNLYTYCSNNPVNRVDPTGHCDTCGIEQNYDVQLDAQITETYIYPVVETLAEATLDGVLIAYTGPAGIENAEARIAGKLAGKALGGAAAIERTISSAKAAQTAGGYLADEFTGTILTKGTKIFGLTPGQTAWYTSADMVEASGMSYKILYEGLQIAPDLEFGYRQYVTAYEVTEDITIATGKALANTKNGTGGFTQYFIENFNDVVKPLYEYPLK